MTIAIHTNGLVGTESELRLNVLVKDRDVLDELRKRPEESNRADYVLSALRVGVLAIRQASGVIDGREIQEQGKFLIETMRLALKEHTDGVSGDVATILRKYFDPSGGEFPLRIERLIRQDGDLEALLNRHVNGDGSSLSQTLAKHLGPTSPLLKLLSPEQQQGLLACLKESLQGVVSDHSRQLVNQFSLDDKESALSRLVSVISEKNGTLRQELTTDISTVRNEFSLDNPEGALSRLVNQFQQANSKILDEFSVDNSASALVRMIDLLKSTNDAVAASLILDDENSSLSRLQRGLFNVVQELRQGNEQFQKEMRETLESYRVRRQEAARSTIHGFDFEDEVCSFIENEARRLNDEFESTTDQAGIIPRCKAGDCILTLGAETAAPGGRIAIEAKGDKSYTLKEAREELLKARENRRAQVGIFVWSKSAAPVTLEPLTRLGCDILVIWNPDEPSTDVYLKTAISLSRLMVVQEHSSTEKVQADILAMETAIATITRDLASLDEIGKWAETIKNNGEKICKKAAGLNKQVSEQIGNLSGHVANLRNTPTC